MPSYDYDAIVVGAGHNGLVCTGYLARAGLSVLVLERRPFVGGACYSEELFSGFLSPGCAHSLGLLQPKVVHDLELHRFGLRVVEPAASSFRPFPDGQSITLWRDAERFVEEIRRLSRRDAEMVPVWRDLNAQIARLLAPYLLREPPTLAEIFHDVRGTPGEGIFERALTTSVADVLDDLFESEDVKALFVNAGDVGNPRAIGSLIPNAPPVQPADGPYHDVQNLVGIPIGGMSAVTEAMARSAASRGATIRTGAEVARIRVEDGAARGVVLADGTTITSRIVVSNADPKRSFLKLVGVDDLPSDTAARVSRLRNRIASAKFHAALDEPPDLSQYLGPGYDPLMAWRFYVLPSVGYWERAWNDAMDGQPARRPVMSVQFPSIVDPSLAPPGKHVVTIFVVYMPVRPTSGTWDDWRNRVGENVIDIVTEYVPNFRRSILDWTVFTPLDLERRVGLTDGSIHHQDGTLDKLFSRRGFARPGRSGYSTAIDNLWMCGAGTHPGGEVSGAPGHNAAQAILRAWPT